MTSFTQRALGLSILFLSVASGMTIARGQVYQSPDGSSQNGIAPPPLPPPGSGGTETMTAPPTMPPLPPPNEFNNAPVEPYVAPPSANSANGNGSKRRGNSSNSSNSSNGAYVPSEVEVFNAASIKHGEPRAIIHTSFGDIVIKLFIGQAPRSVRNFMDLARGDREFTDPHTSKKARRPFYTNLTFHKVVADRYILGGCPLGTGHGGPGYTLPDEISHELKFDKPGLVAMAPARDGFKLTKDSNGSQFFISLNPQPSWDGQFTVIGEVVKGLSIAMKISETPSGPTGRPIRRVFMKTVEIAEDDSGPAGQDGMSRSPVSPSMPAVPPPPMQPPNPAPVVGPASVAPPLPAPPPATTNLPAPPPALPPPPGAN